MKSYVVKAGFTVSLTVLSGLLNAGPMDSMIGDQIQGQIARQTSAGISRNLNENLIIPQLKIRNESGALKDFTMSNDERYYSLLHQDGSVRIWDSRQGVQRPALYPEGKIFTQVASDSTDGRAFIGSADGGIYVYDILTATPITKLDDGLSKEVIALSLSKNEKKLVAAYRDGNIVIWDTKSLKKISRFNTHHGSDLTHILVTAAGKSLLISGESGFMEIWDLEKMQKKASLPQSANTVLGFWENTSGNLIYVDSQSHLQSVEQPSNRILRTQKINEENPITSVSISDAAALLTLSTPQKIKLFNLNNLSLIKEISTAENISNLHFINQGKHLAGADEKGVLHIWDLKSANEVLKLISTDSGWTVVDNVGRFDSSEEAIPNVSWMANEEDIPIDNFSQNYYEPGLLAAHLNRNDFINQQPRKVQAGISLPPEVILTAPAIHTAGEKIKLSFEVVDAGGGIGTHRLYQNGKIIDASFLIESSDDEIDGKLHQKISYNVIALAGVNQFKVIAANKMGIDSKPQQQTLQVSGEQAQSKLHIVTVGINKYLDNQLNLSYSVADAKSIVSALSTTQTFKDIMTYPLLDQGATKSAIADKLKQMTHSAQNDVLVVYFAGHGIAIKGEWYFLPYETTRQTNEQYFTGVGISAKQIEKMLSKIPAQKILVMIDSCYSGAGLKALENLQNSQRHFSRLLSKSVGIVVLAATRQDQKARESKSLGHGLFTYIVNKGLQGEADLYPTDSKVSAHELVSYSTATIPTFSKEFSKAAQEPTSFIIGEDFILLSH